MTDAIAEAPEGAVDLLAARRHCDHAIRKIRDIAEAKRVIESSYHDQIGEVEAWHLQETTRLDGETERLRVAMRPLIGALVEADPLGKLSVELVAGRAGFRAGRDRIVVDDSAACLAWLEAEAPDLVRVKREPDLAAIKGRIAAGERFPGVRVEKGEPSYFVDVIGRSPSGTPDE
jgi:phage host-nuclease inhibitor protein Gam